MKLKKYVTFPLASLAALAALASCGNNENTVKKPSFAKLGNSISEEEFALAYEGLSNYRADVAKDYAINVSLSTIVTSGKTSANFKGEAKGELTIKHDADNEAFYSKGYEKSDMKSASSSAAMYDEIDEYCQKINGNYYTLNMNAMTMVNSDSYKIEDLTDPLEWLDLDDEDVVGGEYFLNGSTYTCVCNVDNTKENGESLKSQFKLQFKIEKSGVTIKQYYSSKSHELQSYYLPYFVDRNEEGAATISLKYKDVTIKEKDPSKFKVEVYE